MNEFLIKLVANGGKGSGNFTPGRGRGVGKPGGIGPAKITKKDVQDLLKPSHDRYTREVTDVKYNPDRDRYEADAVTKHKDGTQNDEFWFTMPGKDPNDGMSWLADNSPTFIEEFTEKMKKVFTE